MLFFSYLFAEKNYEETESSRRRSIFERHFEEVKKHNALYEQGLISYQLELNEFSDMVTN